MGAEAAEEQATGTMGNESGGAKKSWGGPEGDTSVMRILVWVSFPTSQGPIQHLSCFPFPHFQLLVSHFSFLISHILFPTSHSLFPTSCGKWKNDKLNYSMVLYNDSIWKRLVSLRRGINVMKAKHLQNWMKWMNVRSRKFYVGCERWEVRSWKWGFWLLTSHFPFQIYGIWRKKLNWAPRSGRWESNENSHNWSIPLFISVERRV